MVSSLIQPQSQSTEPDIQQLALVRHTCAHIMAMAVQKLYPGTKVAIGPVTETGFFYDFDSPITFTHEHFPKIIKEMRRIIKANLPIMREVVSKAEIKAEIANLGEPYKLEILDSIPDGEIITRYFIGSPDTGRLTKSNVEIEPSLLAPIIIPVKSTWWDLCAGPHVSSTGQIDPNSFGLESLAGAYWRGDETKPMLQRIYGTAWETPEQLAAYLTQKEEALKRDHRKIGQELKLFSIQEDAGGGLVFWHPRGAKIRYIIEDYWRKAHLDAGYELLYTPEGVTSTP